MIIPGILLAIAFVILVWGEEIWGEEYNPNDL